MFRGLKMFSLTIATIASCFANSTEPASHLPPVYLFFHLAKTGGTTFVGHLYKNWVFDEEVVDLGPVGNFFRSKHQRADLSLRLQDDLDKIKVLCGHLVYWEHQRLFSNRECRCVIFLRDPVQRVISHYTFNNTRTKRSFNEWYQSVWTPNQMYKFLCDHLQTDSVSDVLQRLQSFWHIGLQESLDESLLQLYQELGISCDYRNRRVAGEALGAFSDLNLPIDSSYELVAPIEKIYQPSKEEIEMIRKDHVLDIWLYEHIKESLLDHRYRPKKDLNVKIPKEFMEKSYE